MDWLCLRKTALFLYVFLVFILHVSTDAQGHPPLCPVFKVQRGAVHKACINKPLSISCNLKYCDGQMINVSWTKQNLKEWTPVSEAGQISSSQTHSAPELLTSYLTFTNISKHHDGLYRCEQHSPKSSAVSHSINISVSDDRPGDEMSCTEKKENTEKVNTDSSSDSNPWWLPYLFICMGVVIPVLILTLISILCIYVCKNFRSRKTQKTQVQYTATSVLASTSPSVLKRDEFVCVQYSEDTKRHSRDSNTCSLTLPHVQSTSPLSDRGDDYLSNRGENRSSQVVYASLHHLTPTPSSITHRPTREEFSEYAPIRVS